MRRSPAARFISVFLERSATDVLAYGATAGVGAARGPWLIGNAGVQLYDTADDNSYNYGASLGHCI